MNQKHYDIIIIGGGPSGLTAALYGARGGKRVAVFERALAGGQAAQAHLVENYPAVLSISGFDLTQNMQKQAKIAGAVFLNEQVLELSLANKTVVTKKGEYTAQSLILCMGAKPRTLGLEGENQLVGRGVSYCATCDGAFFSNRKVAVMGGGNTALGDAIYLSNLGCKVTLIHRRQQFRATKALVDKLKSLDIELILDSTIIALGGEGKLERLTLKNVVTNKVTDLNTDALFVAIGHIPATELIKEEIEKDEFGYIITNADMSLNGYLGVYAAGDIRQKSLRQIVTACADGAIAAESTLV